MRAYKFRGKTNSGKWVYGSLVWAESQQPQIHFPIFFTDDPKKVLKWDWVYVDEKTVGQCVAKDKNGRDVYEGDVLKQIDANGVYVVIRNEKYFRYEASHTNGFVVELSRLLREHKNKTTNLDAEVVGNIHDNPESIN